MPCMGWTLIWLSPEEFGHIWWQLFGKIMIHQQTSGGHHCLPTWSFFFRTMWINKTTMVHKQWYMRVPLPSSTGASWILRRRHPFWVAKWAADSLLLCLHQGLQWLVTPDSAQFLVEGQPNHAIFHGVSWGLVWFDGTMKIPSWHHGILHLGIYLSFLWFWDKQTWKNPWTFESLICSWKFVPKSMATQSQTAFQWLPGPKNYMKHH